MFYHLYGTLEINDAGTCVIDCGGVGYKLTTSLITSDILRDKIGQNVKLFTHLAVREDGVELFGFESGEERECFNKLITVSGVGPKAAISILSTMSPDRFSLAVCAEDVKAISAAPGIGKKTAARIILELKDKISKETMNAGSNIDTVLSPTPVPKNSKLSEAAEALMVLGYDKATASAALAKVDPSITDVGEIIKAALKNFGK